MTQLRRRMIEDMQIRNLAAPTQTTYLQHVSQFARHFGKSPSLSARTRSVLTNSISFKKGNSPPPR